MTSKLSLLGGIAAGALLFATGAAAAPTLTVDADGSGNPYKLASEASIAPGDTLSFDAELVLSNGNTIPSGNVILTLTLSGGEFEGVIGAGVLSGSHSDPLITCTVSSTVSDGGDGENFVEFLLSGASAGSCDTFEFTGLTVVPTGSGTVSMSADVRTEGDTPIDGGGSNASDVLTRGNAFDVNFTAGTTRTAILASTGGPYRRFAGDVLGTTLGTVEVTADGTFYKDLAGTSVSNADVTAISVVIDGAWGSFVTNATPPVTNVTLGGATAAISGSNATFTYSAGLGGLANQLPTGANALTLTADGVDPILAREYTASVSLTLSAGLTSPGAFSGGDVGEIDRDGTSVIVPGVLSRYLVDRLKENNQIRIGNIGDDDTGAVYLTVLANNQVGANPPAYTPQGTKQVTASIAAGGELLLNSTAITTHLGQFGRGDIELSIEADPSDIVVRRFYRGATGDWTEVASGTVAQDQN